MTIPSGTVRASAPSGVGRVFDFWCDIHMSVFKSCYIVYIICYILLSYVAFRYNVLCYMVLYCVVSFYISWYFMIHHDTMVCWQREQFTPPVPHEHLSSCGYIIGCWQMFGLYWACFCGTGHLGPTWGLCWVYQERRPKRSLKRMWLYIR